MNAFLKLKKKILNQKLKPKSFKNFKFVEFNQINQISFYKLISKKRIKQSFKNKKNITYKKHLDYVKNYKNKPIINFILLCLKTGKIVGLFNIKRSTLGYEIGKSILNERYLGKGLAKKGTIRLIDFFFKIIKKKYIYAITSVHNKKNIDINTKLGFLISGIKKKHYIMKLSDVRFYNYCFKKK